MKWVVLIVLCIALYYATIDLDGVLAFNDNQIQSLPGLAQNLSFRQYSGYLSDGQSYLHYWFVESQANSSSDPVILWLNGGPSVSPLWAMFTENGPYRVVTNASLTSNPNSWNTLANVLYIESPFWVGFSYSDDNTTINSEEVFNITHETNARSNYLALEDFFEKFPHLRPNGLYITGEGYAGIDIPLLALEILRANSMINLKGLAIGNGVLYSGSNEIELYMQLSCGIISIDDYTTVSSEICRCDGQKFRCSDQSESNQSVFSQNLDNPMITNEFNIFSDCVFDITDNYNTTTGDVNCPSADTLTQYLNMPQVRSALHIPDNVTRWKRHSHIAYQTSEPKDMRPHFKELIDSYNMSNIIVFSGDLDMNRETNFIANQRFVDSLGYSVNETYHQWFVNRRIGGFVKRYEGITFTTVRAAGHMTATDQPEATLEVIKELIGVKKLQ